MTSSLTPFKVTFRVGRRTLAWVRFSTDTTSAQASAAKALDEAYFGKARILSIVETPDPLS